MKSLFFLFFFILATASLRADLGETLEQCQSRYGAPIERKPASNVDEMVYFKKEDMKIGVGLREGKCVLLVLGKESGDKLTKSEVEAFLKANEGESLWKKSNAPTANDVWMRSDGYAVAQFASINGILTLVTSDYMKTEMAKKKMQGSGGSAANN